MKSKRYEGSDIRKILAYMATDSYVCSRIARVWVPEGLFASSWANLVGGMIVKHFRVYGKPPCDHMVQIFEEWVQTSKADEKEITSVERFIQSISDDLDTMEKETPEYILDLAGNHFNRVQMTKQIEFAKEDMDRGRIQDAMETLRRFKRVNLGQGSYVVPCTDPELWVHALDSTRHMPLVSYREDLGRFTGDAFMRGTLFSFMASDKVGKTTWLIDFAYRALRGRRRVAYFDTGDGDEDEVLSRMAVRASRRVILPKDQKKEVCIGWEEGEEGLDPVMDFRKFELVDPITAFRSLSKVTGSPEHFRVSSSPSSSISAFDINDILEQWDQEEDWRPDVVVIDYADILAPPKGVKDDLAQIDETWKILRRLSQERHCLVVTATQTSARAYDMDGKGLLGRRHFGGRKTKLAHVNGMLGINVSPEEKEKGLARINWIVRRSDYFNEGSYCRVGGCYAIQSPAMVSKW